MVKNIVIVILVILLASVSLMYLGQQTMYDKAKCASSELLELSKIDFEYINHMNDIINNRNTVEELHKELLSLRAKRSQLINSTECTGDVERQDVFNKSGDINTTTFVEMVNNKNIDAIIDLYTPKAISCGNYPKSKTGEIMPWDVCKGKANGQIVEGYDIGFYESSAFDLFDENSLRETLSRAINDRFFKIDYDAGGALVLASLDNPKEKVVFISPGENERKSFSGFGFQGFNPIKQK